MSKIYLKLILIFKSSLILFVTLLGKNIFAEQTATIIADEIKSNTNTEIVNAKGEVIILNHDGTKIRADEITYEKQKQKLIAKDNIIINDLDGNTYFLDNVITSDGLSYLEGENVRARLSDDSRIVSKDIVKK